MQKFIASLLLGMVCSQAIAQVELKVWNIHPEGYPVTEALENFASKVQAQTQGRVRIKLFNNGVLGDQPKAVQMLKTREVDAGEFNLAPMADIVPEVNVLTRPFLFRDSQHMFQHMDGALGKRIEDKLRKAGIVVLGWYDGGARSFYCVKPVRVPKDLMGQRIRVQQSQTAISMVKLLGGDPVVIPFKEVADAFRDGKIDCAENNLPSYESTGHMKLAKYVYLTNHTVAPEVLALSQQAWAKLSPADQTAVMDAGRQSALFMRERWTAKVESARQAATKQGTQFAPAGDASVLYKRLAPLFNDYLKKSDYQTEVFMVLTQ
ncbi:TRAP transporter substrate-binding protein [Curvibacter sp. CHRR-16]|uniref:TRAP transporter substrate-binding protein n=1 Tax=Curvibacter sp. CHRR-16 TaxID=2835872 RepID=UPI001BDAEECD|nr:TRAP transporter substrate-binding protein [Curvibacter sp. CHRR-16]MBT0571595.1 TRAP transporter substrate-binding protein [Curvibacter sp. CHRR-16]